MMRRDAVAILERLVAFDTISANSNLALIDWVADYLDGFGIESALTGNADGTKANLFATIGPGGRGGVILSGHTDVVPVAGPGLGQRPVPARRPRRPSLRPRHRRHEGVYRTGPGPGAARRWPRPLASPAASRAELRRGGRLPRRAGADPRAARGRGAPAPGDHRRADRDAGRQRAQGHPIPAHRA